jgi:hypothetical protein
MSNLFTNEIPKPFENAYLPIGFLNLRELQKFQKVFVLNFNSIFQPKTIQGFFF